MSGLKRKAQELGEQGLSAAAGEGIAQMVSAAVGRYDAQATVDDQLDDLKRLVVIVHSAVDAAEGVHIRSWWLRRWLWRLRDAAVIGDDVLRLFRLRQERAIKEKEEAIDTRRQQAPVSMLWSTAGRVLRSANRLLKFAVAGDKDIERLNRTVASLEKVATGIGDFLKLIKLEIRMSLPAPLPPPSVYSLPPPIPPPSSLMLSRPLPTPPKPSSTCGMLMVAPPSPPPPRRVSVCCAMGRHENDDMIMFSRKENDDMIPISHEEYTASRIRIVLLIARRKIRRAIHKLRATTARPATGPPCLQPQDEADRLDDLVSEIRFHAAFSSDGDLEVKGRRWLAEWRRGLQAVADRADHLLQLSAPLAIGRGDDDARRTVKSLEAAAAHLRDLHAVFMIYRLREAANVCTEDET